MVPIHEGLEYKDFDGNPGGVTSVSVCLDSGKRATDLCARDQRGFKSGYRIIYSRYRT